MHAQIAGRLTGRVTKWLVLVAWIVLAVVGGGLNAQLVDEQNNEASSWLPESAESTRVLDELSSTLDPNDIPMLVVHHREGGLTDADLAAMEENAAELAGLEGVVEDPRGFTVLTPGLAEQSGGQVQLLSDDREVAYLYLTLNYGEEGWLALPDAAEEIRAVTELDGVDIYLSGFGGQAVDQFEIFEGVDGALILITLSVVVVILLFTYRSPLLWLLPIISAVVAYLCSGAVVYLLARYADLTVNGQSQSILGILVIGAGTDYALLLVARYREELRRHEDRHDAMAVALHRATPAVLASAATVAVGLLCLSVADLNSTAGLGPVLAVGVSVTVLVMVTLLPALLVVTGRWIFWPKRPTFGSSEPTSGGMWSRLGQRISRRPRAVWVGTSLVLAVACLGLLRLDTGGLSTEDTYTQEVDSVVGQSLLREHGLEDNTNTLQVVTDTAAAEQVAAALAGVDGVGQVLPARPIGSDRTYLEVPISEDVSSAAAFEIVEDARAAVRGVDGADALVGGGAAFYLDTKTAATRDNQVIIPMVLLVVFLILVLLLRCLLAPLLLMATVVLSFGAALGISALLFEFVFGFAGSDPGFPLFTFVFLVALGIDYNIFLMTRVREETQIHGTRRGALVALSSTGGVITSAGLVLAATFLVLGSIPLVFLAQIGFTVALGVLLDTLVVRSVLVTALNLDLGSRIWWPSRLDRDEAPSGGGVEPPAPTQTPEPAPV